jgi:replicative DNA helicase
MDESNFIARPYNLMAEQMVLAALLHNNLLYEKVPFLTKDQFFHPIHQEIFQTIVLMIDKGLLASYITIAPIFKSHQAINDAGGEKYWDNMANNLGSISDIESNAHHVYDLFLRRSIIDLGSEIANKASKVSVQTPAINIIEDAEVILFHLATEKTSERQAQPFKISLQKAIIQAKHASQNNALVGVTSGIEALDTHLGGFHKSDLIILAGRPSMGKTALATCFAFNAAKSYAKNNETGAKVAFFSLEMSSEQLALRILGQETRIASDRIRKGIISHKEYLTLESKAEELYAVPMFLDDTPALTMAGLRTRARRLQRQEGIGLIVIDYLQLINTRGGYENRVQELTEITKGLKALAKELNIPVLALSQLSRAVEQREDKQPQLSDLRESGSIEQDSDIVMFIYREAYYEGRKKPPAGSEKMQEWQSKMAQIYDKAELIIAKQRHGPIGTLQLQFDEVTTKFSNVMNSCLN